jgi:hypothetical protein
VPSGRPRLRLCCGSSRLAGAPPGAPAVALQLELGQEAGRDGGCGRGQDQVVEVGHGLGLALVVPAFRWRLLLLVGWRRLLIGRWLILCRLFR